MATTKTPVLSLSTLIERQVIAIDGTHYELRTADEVPFIVYRGYAAQFRRAGELMQKRRSAKDEKELEALLVPLMEAIVIAPKPVLKKLTTDQRWAVLMVFSSLLPTETKAAGAKTTTRRG